MPISAIYSSDSFAREEVRRASSQAGNSLSFIEALASAKADASPNGAAGEACVCAWGSLQTGVRIEIYAPRNSSQENPEYRVVIFDDKKFSVTERMMSLSDIASLYSSAKWGLSITDCI